MAAQLCGRYFCMLQELFFLLLVPLLHFRFALARFAKRFENFMIHKFHRSFCPCIFGTLPTVVLFFTFFEVDTRSTIQRVVAASGKVEVVRHTPSIPLAMWTPAFEVCHVFFSVVIGKLFTCFNVSLCVNDNFFLVRKCFTVWFA